MRRLYLLHGLLSRPDHCSLPNLHGIVRAHARRLLGGSTVSTTSLVSTTLAATALALPAATFAHSSATPALAIRPFHSI